MRQRDEQVLSAEAQAELEALDRALAGEPLDPQFDAVARLAWELRERRPTPSEEFTANLDDRAARGFPSEGAPPSPFAERVREWFAGISPMRVLAPAGAVATVVVVASVAVIQSGGGTDGTTPVTTPATSEERTGAGATAQEQAPQVAPDSDGAAAGEGGAAGLEAPLPEVADETETTIAPAPPTPDTDRIAPGSRREVERSASLSLSADQDEFEQVTDGVVEVTDRYRGFVVSSDESVFGDRSRASFELEVPSDRLQDVLADLSALAHVESRTEDSLDITAPTVTARQQLTDARTEVESLLRQLAEADTPKETERIRLRLDVARADAARAKAEFQKLARRANYANVSVEVTAGGDGDGDFGVDDAVDDIGDALSTAGGVALVAAAIILPFALIIALVSLAWRRSVHRGRERALDAEPPQSS